LADELRARPGAAQVDPLIADLATLRGVRSVAETFQASSEFELGKRKVKSFALLAMQG
jgi:hypothetical protein